MTKPIVMTATTAALLLAGIPVVHAQTGAGPGGPSQPSAQQGQRGAGPGSAAVQEKKAPPRASRSATPGEKAPAADGKAARSASKTRAADRATEGAGSGTGEARERPASKQSDADRKSDRSKATADDQKRPAKQKQSQTKQPQDEKTRRADDQDKRRQDGPRQTETRQPDREPTQRTGDTQKAAPRERVQTSEQQRTRIRDSIRQQNVKRHTDVNFSISVGTRVPRGLSLFALPPTVVEVVPAYRDYRYILVRDEIVIVDPATYTIVDVVDVPSEQARQSGGGVQLSLSPAQERLIVNTVDMTPDTDRLGQLGIGGEIPSGVTVRPFPAAILAEIPELSSYSYFVAERDIVICDANNRTIVHVIQG